MKEVNWKLSVCKKYEYARIGSVRMYCSRTLTNTSCCKWRATACISINSRAMENGKLRHSIGKAKEDAIRLGREMLLDFHESIITEMRSFGLDVS